MKKIKAVILADVSDEIADEMKNKVLCGSFQRELLRDEGCKSVKVTIEFLKDDTKYTEK